VLKWDHQDPGSVWTATDLITKKIEIPKEETNVVERLSQTKNSIKAIKERIAKKRIDAITLNQQYVASKWLIDRNLSKLAKMRKAPTDEVIHIPFVVISSPKQCPIEMQVSEDGEFVLLEYRGGLRLKDDLKVLQLMCKNSNKNFMEVTNKLPSRKDKLRDISTQPR
jgi:hypothetical protein